jgi:disulfide bond formation protein DsbB
MLYRAEDWVWKLHPYVIGSLLTLIAAFVWAYCTGRLGTTLISPPPNPPVSNYFGFPALDTFSPLALPGVATVVFLVLVLVTLS